MKYHRIQGKYGSLKYRDNFSSVKDRGAIIVAFNRCLFKVFFVALGFGAGRHSLN